MQGPVLHLCLVELVDWWTLPWDGFSTPRRRACSVISVTVAMATVMENVPRLH